MAFRCAVVESRPGSTSGRQAVRARVDGLRAGRAAPVQVTPGAEAFAKLDAAVRERAGGPVMEIGPATAGPEPRAEIATPAPTGVRDERDAMTTGRADGPAVSAIGPTKVGCRARHVSARSGQTAPIA
jgi:hypothetical protein